MCEEVCEQDGTSNVTVERVWPQTIKEAMTKYAVHFARYRFAQSYVTGKKVCDVACGVGYGSYLLGEKAERVVGMDICDEAIEWGSRYFMRSNIKFLKCDLAEQWPLDDSFEIITSFETLEHFASPDNFMDEVYNHLLPGGTLILSVPNGPRDSRENNNPYHLNYFSELELKNLIAGHFQEFSCYSQIYKRNFRHHLMKLLKMFKVVRTYRLLDNYCLTSGLDATARTWVVVATK